VKFFLVLLLACASPALALDIQLGTGATVPGFTATVPITFADTPTNLSAFAFYVTNAAALGLPTVQPGPAQPNLSAFVDDFSNGVYRVTGFVLDDPPITNGLVATLTFAVSALVPHGRYPEAFTAAPAPNPEARALVTSELLPSNGANGAVLVTVPPQITHLEVHTDGPPSFHLEFTGTPGLTYTVQGSTNFVDWVPVGTATATLPVGAASFIDSDLPLHPYRFYRVTAP
jgi:hypothetical protein